MHYTIRQTRYTEHEFDHEFIEELSKAIYHFVKAQRKPPSLAQIADHVRTSGVSKVRFYVLMWERLAGIAA